MSIAKQLLVTTRRKARLKNSNFGNFLRVLSLLIVFLISGQSRAALILPTVEPQKWYNWYLPFPGPFSDPNDACRNYFDHENTGMTRVHWEFVGTSDREVSNCMAIKERVTTPPEVPPPPELQEIWQVIYPSCKYLPRGYPLYDDIVHSRNVCLVCPAHSNASPTAPPPEGLVGLDSNQLACRRSMPICLSARQTQAATPWSAPTSTPFEKRGSASIRWCSQ